METTRAFPADLLSAMWARHFVRAALVEWEPLAIREMVALLTTEFVAGAVVYAKTKVVVKVQVLTYCVRVVVRDDSYRLPRQHVNNQPTPNEWGLLFIDALALSWGIELCADGKMVWFEVPRTSVFDWKHLVEAAKG
jgi:hypothetical protein